MDVSCLYCSLSVVSCIHRRLIWQNPVCVVLQRMGLDLSGSYLGTMCDRQAGRSSILELIWLTADASAVMLAVVMSDHIVNETLKQHRHKLEPV